MPKSSDTGSRRPPLVALRLTSYRPSGGRIPGATASSLQPRRSASHRRLRLQRLAVPDPGTFPAVATASELSLILPVPPSVNHQYATVNGRRLLSAAGRDYKQFIARRTMVCLAQSRDREALLATLRGRDLTLSIRFYFSSPLRRDLDGGLKIAQDAICEALGVNDNRIAEIHLFKHLDKSHPRIEVLLRATSPPSPPPPSGPHPGC